MSFNYYGFFSDPEVSNKITALLWKAFEAAVIAGCAEAAKILMGKIFNAQQNARALAPAPNGV